jgi:phage host-nuclease inhibitor protein Gam
VKKVIANKRKADPNAKKSINFVLGTAGYRKGKEKVDIENEETALNACHEFKIDTIIKETVSKKAIKTHIENGGPIPEGVKILPQEEKFYVKIEDEK